MAATIELITDARFLWHTCSWQSGQTYAFTRTCTAAEVMLEAQSARHLIEGPDPVERAREFIAAAVPGDYMELTRSRERHTFVRLHRGF